VASPLPGGPGLVSPGMDPGNEGNRDDEHEGARHQADICPEVDRLHHSPHPIIEGPDKHRAARNANPGSRRFVGTAAVTFSEVPAPGRLRVCRRRRRRTEPIR
jgi:hypothetical protein